MNKVIMTGRLTKDPEMRYTADQKAIAGFSIAVDRRDKKTDFFACTAFGKTAEHMEKYWKKGMKAAIVGRLENDDWTTKDGQKRTTTKILVDEIEFCEKKEKEEDFVPQEKEENLPWNF